MTAERALKMGIRPLAKIDSYSVEGCEPELMGTGPIYAVRDAIERLSEERGKKIDLVELNEAFAAQSLACLKELHLVPGNRQCQRGRYRSGSPYRLQRRQNYRDSHLRDATT